MQPPFARSSLFQVIAVQFAAVALVGCHSRAIDRQMNALCRIDGGMKVYEPVKLPASYYESSGRLRVQASMATGQTDGSWFSRIGNDEYRVVVTDTYLVGARPLGEAYDETLVRTHIRIYKWPEQRLLGEDVSYRHGYGTRFSFGFQPGGTHCPEKRANLQAAVFIREER